VTWTGSWQIRLGPVPFVWLGSLVCLFVSSSLVMASGAPLQTPSETHTSVPPENNSRLASSILNSVLHQAQAEEAQELSYEAFIQAVEKNHPKITTADLKRRIAGAKYLEKQGAFDPGLTLESDYLRYNDFTSRGKVSETFDNDLGLSVLTRSGIKLSAGGRYNTGDVKPPLYPTGDSGEYYVGIKVPLLRGFRINEKTLAERQAKLGIPEADLHFANARLMLLEDASIAYWEWVAAKQKQAVAEKLLGIAQDRYKAVRSRVILGDLPSIDEVETLQEVTRREGQVAKALRDTQKALLKVGLYWWQDNGLPAKATIKPPEALPEPVSVSDDDWMDAREAAIEKRPELSTLDIERQMTEVDLAYAKNLRLPILDLFAQPGLDTGGSSIGPTMKAGVMLTIPLRQRTARGKILAANYSLQQIDVTQRMTLQQVLNEVDDAVSALKTIFVQYEAAQKELTLSRLLEEGEREKFTLGDSTIFMMNQRERARAEAEMKRLDVLAAYQQATAVFRAVSASF
jgi:outer membrane protein